MPMLVTMVGEVGVRTDMLLTMEERLEACMEERRVLGTVSYSTRPPELRLEDAEEGREDSKVLEKAKVPPCWEGTVARREAAAGVERGGRTRESSSGLYVPQELSMGTDATWKRDMAGMERSRARRRRRLGGWESGVGSGRPGAGMRRRAGRTEVRWQVAGEEGLRGWGDGTRWF
ncbi:hypothetical protein BOTBODRAFT_497706 [Botryobasidium botryosum FD-172 SS1]|uniref:Uncharacterized protein n=1 Tax=Botryobasidium botryosum (strain FD-172 SS1) TaxID=930990 RepID=A0A067M401_BOTB1|nr:hypothetical protein BOTBODRAFT_497706 [Botryobasidium botryosum FD-172 SS1]